MASSPFSDDLGHATTAELYSFRFAMAPIQPWNMVPALEGVAVELHRPTHSVIGTEAPRARRCVPAEKGTVNYWPNGLHAVKPTTHAEGGYLEYAARIRHSEWSGERFRKAEERAKDLWSSTKGLFLASEYCFVFGRIFFHVVPAEAQTFRLLWVLAGLRPVNHGTGARSPLMRGVDGEELRKYQYGGIASRAAAGVPGLERPGAVPLGSLSTRLVTSSDPNHSAYARVKWHNFSDEGDFEDLLGDISIIALSNNTMDAPQLFRGDTVLVRGKKRKDTVLIVLADDDLDDGSARLPCNLY
ncbi:hypothetical protein CONLIGDRAFT_650765 [Coniochaeta ligniaria NRRL 30616]|uniref:Uncharacterized protein n=1 Tax=Coniochaeta ligniaria NRRL 30616 TaxID=1408157 RepID=A0A1J7J3R5_9PEZI|nr:hypothetical protein CONLIGDRAFT_650765 [Coniochaeta ligniaria NRRL 30616]